MNVRTLLLTPLGMALLAGPAMGQDNDDSISRSEYEEMKQQLQQLQERVDAVDEKALPRKEADDYFDYLDEEIRELGTKTDSIAPGTSRFLIAGYASSTLTYREDEKMDFGASFSPVFLWQINDRLLFEAEPEFSLGGGHGDGGEGETSLDLEYANISYLVNDYMTVGAGQFLTPFSIFGERLHPAWINKLPDAPMAFDHHGGLAPGSSLGAFARGGVPVGPVQRINYALYVSNGPRLLTEGHGHGDEAGAGALAFDNWDNVNRQPAVGGRLGWLPFPELELGYSFQYTPRVTPDGSDVDNVGAQLHAVDLTYVREVDWLGGRIDLRSEWLLSEVEDAAYEVHGTPVEFNNQRWGGYVQGAYRPTMSNNEIVGDMELVYRYDLVDHPGDAPSGTDTNRHTGGVNYWLTETAVFKSAYQYTKPDDNSGDHGLLFEFAMGF